MLSGGLLSIALSACDWVDSTGSQGSQTFQTEVFLDDTPVGNAIDITENVMVKITTSRDTTATDDQIYSWSAAPLAQGNLDTCAAISGFNPDLAVNSLEAACTVASNCLFEFLPSETTDGVAEFSLEVPQLKASVGLRYSLTVTDTSDRLDTRELDFCLVAINEAPVAVDDTFAVLEGTQRFVSTNEINLLSNDSDDIDDSNTEYRILPQPIVAPRFAQVFELGPDGSFTYESNLHDLDVDTFDTFEYALSDGLHTSSAIATIRVVVANQAPQQLADIPILTAVEGDLFIANLAQFFEDPEGGDLEFYFSNEDDFPGSGSLGFSADGVLAGVPDERDVGIHELILAVSDGSRVTEVQITIDVEAAPDVPNNAAPEYIDGVFNQSITLRRFILAMRAEFEDTDGDELTYSMAGTSELPLGVTLDVSTGVISGRPAERVWVRDLRVMATDPSGASAESEAFYIRVR